MKINWKQRAVELAEKVAALNMNSERGLAVLGAAGAILVDAAQEDQEILLAQERKLRAAEEKAEKEKNPPKPRRKKGAE